MSSKYLEYQIEDWIIDDDFISYVTGQNPALSSTINDLSKNSKLANIISIARQSVLDLQKQQIAVSDDKLEALFGRIDNTIDQKTNSASKKSTRLYIISTIWTAGIAASIALLIFFNPFQNTANQEFLTEVGEQQNLQLPDLSEVALNTVSHLTVDRKNWDKDRNVVLEGEAFFKVEKGSKFTVQSNQGKVSVLGTQFNVYDREGLYAVECIEGKVKVDLVNGESYELLAGDQLSKKGSRETVIDRKVVQTIDWLNNYVDMKDMKLSYVLEEVERYFDVKFEIPMSIDTLPYSGFFNTTSLDSALYQILWPLDIEYTIQGNIIRLDKR